MPKGRPPKSESVGSLERLRLGEITPYEFSSTKLGYKGSFDEWEKLRNRGCIDLFWLAKSCLKLDLVDSYVCPSHPVMMGPEPAPCKICGQEFEPCPGLIPGVSVHREICNAFVHKNPAETLFNQDTKKTRAIFAPRNSYKSSIDRADCVQWVVCFPDIRILIFSATPQLGDDFVAAIREWFLLAKVDEDFDKFETSKDFELFHQLYPEHLINPAKRGAAMEFITPARKRKWVEATIFSLPLEGNTAGYHADVGKFDDCVSDANSGPRSSEQERQRVGENMRLKSKLILPTGYKDYIGTPYAEDDAYSHLLQFRKPEVVLNRPAWKAKEHARKKKLEDLEEGDVDLLLPLDGKAAPLLTYKYLKAELDDDERLFCSQYLCEARPPKSEIVFSEFVIRDHEIPDEGLPQPGTYQIISVWDIASSVGKQSDYSVGGVGLFVTEGPLCGRVFIVDIVRGKFSRFELPHQIAAQAARFKVDRIYIEKSPGVDFMENDIMRELVICGYPTCPPPDWFPVDNNKDAKALRIENISAVLGQDRLYFLNTLKELDTVRDELMKFRRNSRHKDDTADMISMLVKYIPTHIELPKNEQERQSKAEEWLKQKQLHDRIYDPEQFMPKPPEPAPVIPTEFEGYPCAATVEAQQTLLYGT